MRRQPSHFHLFVYIVLHPHKLSLCCKAPTTPESFPRARFFKIGIKFKLRGHSKTGFFTPFAMLQKHMTMRSLSLGRPSANRAHQGQYRSQVVRVYNAAHSPASSQASRVAQIPFTPANKRVLPLLSELVEIQVCGHVSFLVTLVSVMNALGSLFFLSFTGSHQCL